MTDQDQLYVVSADTSYISSGPPVVTFPSAFQLVRGGKVVASVDARYDFSSVAPEYHLDLVRLIASCSSRLALPVYEREEPAQVQTTTPEHPQEPRQKRSWWKHLWGLP